MNPLMITSTATILIFFVAAALSTTHAAQISFTAGNPAVAADVNANFTELYTLNPTAWTNTTGNLGYTGGNLGVGIASPLAKFQVNGGSAITLAGATGFGVFGATTGNHIAVDATQIQAKSNATTAANLSINPLGGNVGIGFTSPTMKLVVSGNTTSSIAVHSALDNTAYRGIGYHFIHEATENAYIIAQRPSGVADGADLIFQTRPTAGALTSRMVVQSTGEVGIGTTSPANTLEVVSVIGTNARGTANGQYSSDILGALVAARKARGTPAAPTSILSGDQLGIYTFQGYDGTGFLGGAYMAAVATENWTGSAHGTRLSFTTTTNGTTTTTERMRINDVGDVAIGSVNPSVALHIVGAVCSTGGGGVTACASDARLKKDIQPLGDALAMLLRLNVRSWRWNNLGVESFGFKENEASLGLVAQEVEKINPAWVTVAPNGYKRVEEGFLKFYTLRAIQQLHQNSILHKAEMDTQILTLQKRATEAEQKHVAGLRQAREAETRSQADREKAEARVAKLEKLLAEESQARKYQELRLAQLEQNLNRMALRFESQNRAVARK